MVVVVLLRSQCGSPAHKWVSKRLISTGGLKKYGPEDYIDY